MARVLVCGDLTYQLGDSTYLTRITSVVEAMAVTPHDAIISPGDISNDEGTAGQYALLTPVLESIKADIYPALGNHDLGGSAQGDGAAYFDYFGDRAGEVGKGWYSFDLDNNWHCIALRGANYTGSSLDTTGVDAASEQGLWLAADLAANAGKHILAFWHVPAVSPGAYGDPRYWKAEGTFWHQLDTAGAEIVVNGHDHLYARYAKQDWNGNLGDGVRQFIVGTGFSNHAATGGDATNLQKAQGQEGGYTTVLGFLELDLLADGYAWEYRYVDPLPYGHVIPLVDRGASVLRGASYPEAWITADNDGVYMSGSSPTLAGWGYLESRLGQVRNPPATGLDY